MEEQTQKNEGEYEDVDNKNKEIDKKQIKSEDNLQNEKTEGNKDSNDENEDDFSIDKNSDEVIELKEEDFKGNEENENDNLKDSDDYEELNENNNKKDDKEEKIDNNNNKENNEILKNEKVNPNFNNIKFKSALNSINNIKKENKDNNINQDINKDEKIHVPTTKELIRAAIIRSKDKDGSEMIQIEFRNGNKEIRQKLFNALKSEILILSKDQFGNYVIQALLYYGDEEKKNFIFEDIKNNIFDLSIDTYGCRVLQTLISLLSNSEEGKEKIKYILSELNCYLRKLFTDQNGNHVIQIIIQLLDIDDLTIIFNAILQNINIIINDKYGTRIIQTFLNKCKKEQALEIINTIFEKYKDNLNDLCRAQFSNYILQYILENYSNYIENINKSLKGNIYEFSLDKYASNIVEKVLEYGTNEQKDEIGKEIINNNNCILNLSTDRYGNYVIQKAIEFCSEEIGKEIIKNVKEIPKEKRGKYWKYIYNFFEKYD